jgi:hypothetical protein
MAQRGRRTPDIDISPLVETLGLAEVIRQIGEANVLRELGTMEQLDARTILDNLPVAKRRQLKRLLAEE